MRPSDKAWIALAIGVFVYEVAAKEGEMMSHAVDRYLVTHPWITTGVVAATALHLINILPEAIDPWHLAFIWRKKFSGNS